MNEVRIAAQVLINMQDDGEMPLDVNLDEALEQLRLALAKPRIIPVNWYKYVTDQQIMDEFKLRNLKDSK
jgi:hypothetical protein